MRELRPFAADDRTRGFALRAGIEGSRIVWELRGRIGSLRVPPRSARPARRTGLWNGTVFEAFLARDRDEGSPYIELNVSPSGDWNAFGLQSYRTGLAELLLATAPRIDVSACEGLLRVECAWERGEARVASLAAVLEHAGGALSHWALAHTGREPDFHRRDSFVLELEGA